MNFIDGKLPPFTDDTYEKIFHLSKKSRRAKLRKWRRELIFKKCSDPLVKLSKKEIEMYVRDGANGRIAGFTTRVSAGVLKGLLLHINFYESNLVRIGEEWMQIK